MNKELTELLKAVKDGVDLASGHLVPLAEEIVTRELFSHAFEGLLFLSLLIVLGFAVRWAKKNHEDGVFFLSTIGIIICFFGFVGNLFYFIQCSVYPRLVIIEYISNLL